MPAAFRKHFDALSNLKPSFRNALYAGVLLAFGLGLYLSQLWNAREQVHLHSAHLIAALEEKDWSEVEGFLDLAYSDQWGHDRELILSRLRQVLPYARNLRIEVRETVVRASEGAGEWSGRVTLDAEPNELSALIKDRINPLDEPFTLEWRKGSWKPWDWKLVRVTNPALELSGSGF